MKTTSILKKVIRVLDSSCKQELIKQGHSLTGALEKSIRGDVKNTKAEGYMLDYGFIVDKGVKSNKIPFNGTGKSGAKSSKYITSLINYFKIKGLSEAEAKKAAFATAYVQKKEGMSTKSSSRFSKNNKRQNFLDSALTDSEPKVDKIILSGIEEIFDKEFNKQKSEII
ncbi:hypothetical protein ETU09_05795 [Apibacter muscae]|uniref:Uncharacterized protein n=1 Tax=Apibacter muscae TaxID=2509004 RepID=A0A563DE06_9FLAO|nr:hypothetical protein [Apibacter muscae]TWP28436.1 hypothetical protein ETU09_05795 [Apibacter muscae]